MLLISGIIIFTLLWAIGLAGLLDALAPLKRRIARLTATKTGNYSPARGFLRVQ